MRTNWEEFENTENTEPIRVHFDTDRGRIIKGLLVDNPRGFYVVDSDEGERIKVSRTRVRTYAQWPAREGTAYLGGR